MFLALMIIGVGTASATRSSNEDHKGLPPGTEVAPGLRLPSLAELRECAERDRKRGRGGETVNIQRNGRWEQVFVPELRRTIDPATRIEHVHMADPYKFPAVAVAGRPEELPPLPVC